MVGSSVADGTLLVTTLPLNPKTLGTKPLTIAQPDRYMAPTFESDLGKDCDLDHHWSTASAYNSQLFVLCYPKIEVRVIFFSLLVKPYSFGSILESLSCH